MARQTFETWVIEAAQDEQFQGPCTAIGICHIKGVARTEVYTIRFGSKAWTAAEIAKTLRHKAEGYAQDLDGVQTFELQAFYNSSNEPQVTKPVRIDGKLDLDGLGTEGPTPTGILAQGMRHLEAATQAVFKKDTMLFESMRGVIDTLSSRYAEAAHELNDATKLINELVRDKITAENESAMKRLEYERASTERSKLIGMIPPLTNTITGREVFPQAFADSALLDSIGDSLDEEQIAKLGQILKPEQMALIAHRFAEKLKKQREAREADERNERQLAERNGNGAK